MTTYTQYNMISDICAAVADGAVVAVEGKYRGEYFEGVVTDYRAKYGDDVRFTITLDKPILVGADQCDVLPIDGSALYAQGDGVTSDLITMIVDEMCYDDEG